MAYTLQGDTTEIRSTGAKTEQISGELNGLLARIVRIADELRPILNTPITGANTQKAFAQNDAAGRKLTGTMSGIATNLGVTATRVDSQDATSGAQVNAVSGVSIVNTGF
ncbi:hypothetical protein [Nocardia sp. NPDC049149]|uniref:hypothetical protein n=1 Tax=Nocardia sp. NPDC049149 TaxID=3364315 RepID=UPI00371F63CC